MYIPEHFAEPQVAVMHDLMCQRPFATLVTLAGGDLEANHIPLLLDPTPGPYGTLRGHVARANPAWRDLLGGAPALAVFDGPDAYITPTWYATKRETGKVVPTWNYVAVHAQGTARAIEDGVWLRAHLNELTHRHETGLPQPWAVTDAPADYIDRLMAAIVGIELVITKLIGKWKLSQNQPPANRDGVVTGLNASANPDAQALAARMASEPAHR